MPSGIHRWVVVTRRNEPDRPDQVMERFTITASNPIAVMERLSEIMRGVYERADTVNVNFAKVVEHE